LDNQKLIAIFNSTLNEQPFPKEIFTGCKNDWELISGAVENGKIQSKYYTIFVRK